MYLVIRTQIIDCAWVKLCASFFGFDKDLFLCLAYVSPETSSHSASRDNIWNLFEEEIAYFSTIGNILLTGDLNARTGLLPDFVNYDTDLYVPLPNGYIIDKSIPRQSEDAITNRYGRELLLLSYAK